MKPLMIKKEEEEHRDRLGTNEMDKDEVERWYPSCEGAKVLSKRRR